MNSIKEFFKLKTFLTRQRNGVRDTLKKREA
jgi:hypothetical protein